MKFLSMWLVERPALGPMTLIALILFGFSARPANAFPPKQSSNSSSQSDEREDEEAVPADKDSKPKTQSPEVVFANFLKRIEKSIEPANALELIQEGLSAAGLTVQQEKALLEQKRIWEDRKAKDLHRLGTKWVKQEDVQAAQKKGQELLAQAEGLAKSGDLAGSVEILLAASKANENGIRADFTLGLIRSLPHPQLYDVDLAEDHFRNVLNRSYDHPAALNSLATTLIKQNKFGPAYSYFEKAIEVSGNCPEALHNISRALFLSDDGRLKLDKNTKKKFLALHAAKAAGSSVQFNQQIGWKHMLPIFSPEERTQEQRPESKQESAPRQPTPPEPELNLHSMGSCFVVARGYVVTNRHVIEDDNLGPADKITILDPHDPTRTQELDAQTVAASDTHDLAILKISGLRSEPILLRSEPLELGAEIVVLGFPEPSRIGTALKVTRGIVSGVPDPTLGKRLLFDATSGPGNSGGPVCDIYGRVGAVLTWGFQTQIAVTGGIPAEEVRTLFKESLQKELPAPPENMKEVDTQKIVESHRYSVCQVHVYYRQANEVALSPEQTLAIGENPYHEDRTCPLCSGRGWMGCQARGCVKGGMAQKGVVRGYAGGGGLSMPAQRQVTRRVDCPNCDGGRVDCPGCQDGIDRFLR